MDVQLLIGRYGYKSGWNLGWAFRWVLGLAHPNKAIAGRADTDHQRESWRAEMLRLGWSGREAAAMQKPTDASKPFSAQFASTNLHPLLRDPAPELYISTCSQSSGAECQDRDIVRTRHVGLNIRLMEPKCFMHQAFVGLALGCSGCSQG